MSANNGNMLKGLIAAIAIAAFFGGYVLGTNSGPSDDEIAQLIMEYNKKPLQIQEAVNAPSDPSPIFVSHDDDPFMGNPDAPITIVEFSDFQCPFCSRFYQETLPSIEQAYINTGMVKLVYRDMPLGIHKNAIPTHVAAECANVQGAFWAYHDVLFEQQNQWKNLDTISLEEKLIEYAKEIGLDSSFDSCIKSSSILEEVQKDYAQATGYGVTGTPTFFIGNDEIGFVKLSGAKPFSDFQSVIESQLNT